MGHYRIRSFQPADADRVHELADRLQIGVAAWRSPDRVRSTIRTWVDRAIQRAGADDHALLVASDEADHVIAFISVNVQQHHIDGRDAYIGELAVDADYERLGVATRLLRAAEEWAAEHDCERLTLQTGAANDGARAFYKAHGFVAEDISFARPIG